MLALGFQVYGSFPQDSSQQSSPWDPHYLSPGPGLERANGVALCLWPMALFFFFNVNIKVLQVIRN